MAALGTDLFNYLEGSPEEEREFSDLMAALTTLWAGDAADLIDTTDVNRAIDVGGSSGSLLRQLQERNPQLRGVIFDRPNVAREIAPLVSAGDMASRTEVVGGDFFVSVPAGDLYLLKMILHDWDDEHCVSILTRCREAMKPNGRVAIVEMVGKRTLREFDALLPAAGRRRTTTHAKPSGHNVIEASAS
jgi:O-methyltransferase domain